MTNPQTNKQAGKLCNKQTCKCIVLIQGNGNILMKFAAASPKTLKTVKCLPKILFNIDIMDLCLLLCFCILLKVDLKVLQRHLCPK